MLQPMLMDDNGKVEEMFKRHGVHRSPSLAFLAVRLHFTIYRLDYVLIDKLLPSFRSIFTLIGSVLSSSSGIVAQRG